MIYVRKRGTISKHMSGYVQASTDNPTGWRPQYMRLGDLTRGPRQIRPRVLGLGDCDATFSETGICVDPNTGSVVSAPSENDVTNQANAISQYFQKINAQLIQNESDAKALVAQTGQALPADIGQSLVQNRNDFESYLSKYNTAYAMAFGTMPTIPGLQGLGLDSSILIAVMSLLSPLGGLVAILWQNALNTKAKLDLQKQQAQTQSTLANQLPGLQKQYTDAVARGDSATAGQVQQQIAAINQNISSIGGGGGASDNPLGGVSTFLAGMGTGSIVLLGLGAVLLLSK